MVRDGLFQAAGAGSGGDAVIATHTFEIWLAVMGVACVVGIAIGQYRMRTFDRKWNEFEAEMEKLDRDRIATIVAESQRLDLP